MRMRQFLKDKRAELDAYIRQKLGDPDYRLNDSEREQWVANDETLYNWARDLGVNV